MARTRQNRNLLPLRDYDEHDVVNMYSLEGTGLAGQLVKVKNLDLDEELLWDRDQPVGADFSDLGIYSNRFVNPAKVTPTVNGDTIYDGILGLTLVDTREFDENGQKLILGHRRKANENSAILSGETVPVITKGIFLIGSAGYVGTPAVGKVAVPHTGGAGKLYAADPTNTVEFGPTGTYSEDQVVGRWLSATGSRQNGYALLKLEL
jgi:hypothetical protein